MSNKKNNKANLNNNTSVEALTLKDKALSFAADAVDAMVAKIRASFARRDDFESKGGKVSLATKKSYTDSKARWFKNEQAIARFLLALGIEPSSIIERRLFANGEMFNAKALKKISELASFACGTPSSLEKVTRCFLVCAIAATDKGVAIITNETNRRFLNNRSIDGLITDADLLKLIAEERLKTMSEGASTQSSQMRNVLEVLGCGKVHSLDSARDAIELDGTHELLNAFRERFMTAA